MNILLRNLVKAVRSVDAEFYRNEYPDIKHLNDDEIIHHYLSVGWIEGRNPNSWFDTVGYWIDHPDVAKERVCPLLHYYFWGKAEGRHVRAPLSIAALNVQLFDDKNVDWVDIARREVDEAFYKEQLKRKEAEKIDYVAHYVFHGWRVGLSPSHLYSRKSLGHFEAEIELRVPDLILDFAEARFNSLNEKAKASDQGIAEVEGANPSADEPGATHGQEPAHVDHGETEVRWLDGAFSDGWMQNRALLQLRNVRSIDFRASLPPDELDKGKSVTFHFGDQIIHEARIARGTVNEFTVVVPEARKKVTLGVECDYPERKRDLAEWRDLGFICPAYRVNGGEWVNIRTSEAVAQEAESVKEAISLEEYIVIEPALDEAFYRKQFGANEDIGNDAVYHYLTEGVRLKRDPCPWFSTAFYLETNPDVAEAGVNPLAHFLNQGRKEGRLPSPPEKDRDETIDPASGVRERTSAIFAERQKYCEPGEDFEDLDPSIVRLRKPLAKAIAFYLPQFHPIAENDAWWGKGFTEWRNVVRGQPRFKGHYQPRTPRDLGFYDLRRPGVMREQAAQAKAAGIHGFCFYYYSFNGRRLLDDPIDAFLKDGDIDLSFSLMWANENWTRTWDGHDKEVLLSQDYREEDEDALIADVSRHFADRRYIRIDGRPIFFIYRPSLIPETASAIARWREKFETKHGEKPLMFMAQGFDDLDPRAHGLDGAIEFPPHKICANMPAINNRLDIFDPGFTGHVLDYGMVVKRSLEEPEQPFPLIKTATPSWDNDARRPGRGMTLQGSNPKAYGEWLGKLVEMATRNPVFGEAFVAINAWNEWAEGAYLEPDVYYGSAYLNATARALTRTPARSGRHNKILIVGHDAYRHGAQLLVQNMATVLSRQFGAEVTILVCGAGPLVSEYEKICDTVTVVRDDSADLERKLMTLWNDGYHAAIVNTTVSGWTVPALKAQGFAVCTLVHELKALIQEYRLENYVAAIADGSDAVVFPAQMVRDSFLSVAKRLRGDEIIQPQGLYKLELANGGPNRAEARARLGIAADKKVVINVGYADSRKGFDIFLRAAQELRRTRDDTLFLWVGDATPDIRRWLLPDVMSEESGSWFKLTGFTNDVAVYYAAADAFLLTSREDPFPSVVLEALAAGLPVVGLEGTTGCAELIARFGRLVDRHDIGAICAAIVELTEAAPEGAAAERRKAMRDEFRFDAYCHGLMRRLDPNLPSVSVIVPNYNYARYMPERLSSIFRQTHPVLEVIVLDDRSTDDSVDVIREIAAETRRDIDLVVNESNSGSVFRQWLRGAERARGEFVWIAESDDVADEQFLEVLAKRMVSEEADLAFCDSWQIDTDGKRLGNSYRFYMNEFAPSAFDAPFCMPGEAFARQFLSVKNVILNVSGVLWRRKALLAALEAAGDQLFAYKVAGDWRLYAEVCARGGNVVYESRALNGHRRHQTSVTHALAARTHYNEILAMQTLIGARAQLSHELLNARAGHRAEVRKVLHLETVADDEPNDPGAGVNAARKQKESRGSKKLPSDVDA